MTSPNLPGSQILTVQAQKSRLCLCNIIVPQKHSWVILSHLSLVRYLWDELKSAYTKIIQVTCGARFGRCDHEQTGRHCEKAIHGPQKNNGGHEKETKYTYIVSLFGYY